MNHSSLQSHAAITAFGAYVPDKVLSNEDLAQMVDTNHDWIVQRTGIVERRIASDDQFCSDLCFKAVRNMQSRYAVNLTDVDFVLVATTTPDTYFPSMSARVQAEFGITNCGAVDIQAACSGFVAGLQLANGLLLSGVHRKILVIGAETLTKATDYTDRSTCILFGDGAGAVLLERSEQGSFIGSYVSTNGSNGHHLYRSSLAPSIGDQPILTNGMIVQNGREVYRWAVSNVPKGIKTILEQNHLAPDDIDWFIPHSANMRIVESICEKTGIKLERTLTSMAQYGNTSAASIPLAIDLALQDSRIRAGDLVLLYGFGGGLTEAALLLRWTL
ncbi:3-oxoacyl-[acyl-carrier-protein] synthase 3 [Paenibacillus baekrokdamisoli]|uniref:Beta-ketoacyl-[acyl-carrier-protein] synthase III n=1 Tax=Paenibacillus baekrokdamisoli TaxID=1712516 RepID=A0A3G9IRW6_9BACL|nr:ketoacyl-ACP synthase III [Paenibacillus baekrokdamisoli]MBB3069325.1 3-oxoacyl-[acyl-carrier-protein] synthase-3 [Paenibacillus baekrokdamisoli]BBH18705.1 3-oxoacyl-[acyl-carrier-protein] synthase 3 [Paenibacillus baekrokdamisoli]